MLKPREQILIALNHEEPDQVPVDFGSTAVTGISVSVVHKLREYFGLDNSELVRLVESYQMLGEIGEDLMRAMGVDCIGVWNSKNMFGFKND